MKYLLFIILVLSGCDFKERVVECRKKKCPAPFEPYMLATGDGHYACLCQVVPK